VASSTQGSCAASGLRMAQWPRDVRADYYRRARRHPGAHAQRAL